MQPITPFDCSEQFTETIRPMLDDIKKFCANNKIPFFYEFAVKNDEKETTYERDILTPRPMGLGLHENTLLQHNLIVRGFRAVPPSEIQEIDMTDSGDIK